MVFVQKWPFFQLLFVRQCRPGKGIVFDILELKTAFSGYEKKSSKSRKIAIFPKPMVLVQKWPFFQLFFFLGNIG